MRFVRQLLLALSFLTRIPVRSLDLSKTDFARATVYFPVIGTFIGLVGAGIFWLSDLYFPVSVSVAITLGALIMLTGAIHEDGLADAFDAFGSKTTKEDILETMRDSRIGTYAALALFVVLLIKFAALQEMQPHVILLAFVLVHTVSRWAMLPTLALLPYPRKSAAISKRFVEAAATMPKWHVAMSFAYTCVIAWLLVGYVGLFMVVLATVIGLLFTWYFWKKIQGATGDCYGTIQQCSEAALYMSMLLLL